MWKVVGWWGGVCACVCVCLVVCVCSRVCVTRSYVGFLASRTQIFLSCKIILECTKSDIYNFTFLCYSWPFTGCTAAWRPRTRPRICACFTMGGRRRSGKSLVPSLVVIRLPLEVSDSGDQPVSHTTICFLLPHTGRSPHSLSPLSKRWTTARLKRLTFCAFSSTSFLQGL